MFKKTIKRIVNSAGYDISRKKLEDTDDSALYSELYPTGGFYNIGAGWWRHPKWINIDHHSDWYGIHDAKTDIDHDLLSLEHLPIESDSASVVYTSHTVEHIFDDAAQNMFNEAYRILKKGGYFRLTTPDIDLEYRAYKQNDKHFFYWSFEDSPSEVVDGVRIHESLKGQSTAQIFIFHFASVKSTIALESSVEKITDVRLKELFDTMLYEDALNYCTAGISHQLQQKYTGFHVNWWNAKKATRMLKVAGFSEVYRSGYGQSFCPLLRNTNYFDSTDPKISLYIEAKKI